MGHYKYIFFDLDHTLWDFERNSQEVLYDLFVALNLDTVLHCDFERFMAEFNLANNVLWKAYSDGEIKKDELRAVRFKMIFTSLFESVPALEKEIAEQYIKACPLMPYVMPGTYDLLMQLKEKYPLYILTNGFTDIQLLKMDSAELSPYFTEVFTAENVGYKKPRKEFFDNVLRILNADVQECIMIGDNIETDIQGAADYGIDQVLYNPKHIDYTINATYEISHLEELLAIL